MVTENGTRFAGAKRLENDICRVSGIAEDARNRERVLGAIECPEPARTCPRVRLPTLFVRSRIRLFALLLPHWIDPKEID
jgi:hypothetical protein